MNTFHKLTVMLATTAVLSAPVYAGLNANTNTYVGTNVAYGSVHDARNNNSGQKEYLSCYIGAYVVQVTDTTAQKYISCSAENAAGQTYYCYDYTPPAEWVEMITSLNSASWLYFYGDASHHCQGLNTSQGSQYL